jgi:iron complex transport system ATP-binding protein
MTDLRVKNASVSRGGSQVVKNVSALIRPGELVGLLGPNGVGKTTLLKAMAGLMPLSEGELLLGDKPLAAYPAANRAKIISYLPQGADCHWPLTVEHVVALGRLPHQAPWGALPLADMDRVFECMGYTDVLHLAGRPVTELSGGERTRVLLARAIAGNPQILLADEPVAGLDPAHQMDVMLLLKGLAEKGAGVVAVLHDLTLAARYADRILLMSEGRLLADGPPEVVLSPANLAECFGIRVYAGRVGTGVFVVPTERISAESTMEERIADEGGRK